MGATYPIWQIFLPTALSGAEMRIDHGHMEMTYVLADAGRYDVSGDETWTLDGEVVGGCSSGPTVSAAWTQQIVLALPSGTWTLDRGDVMRLCRRHAWPKRESVVTLRATRCL